MNTCHTSHPPDRDIAKLNPEFLMRVQGWLAENPHIAVHEALRTADRQACLIKNGRSWVPRSTHQDGLAVDIHFKEAPHFPPRTDPRWNPVIESAVRWGIDNGYVMWKTDTNHFQRMQNPPPLPIKTSKVEEIIQQQIRQNSDLWHQFRALERQCQTARTQLHQQNEAWRIWLSDMMTS